MKKILTTVLLLQVCCITTYAQDSDYRPLVREDVRWVNRTLVMVQDHITTPSYYGIQLFGDTVINTTDGQYVYKKCYSFSIDKSSNYVVVNFEFKTPVAYLREDDKKVYGMDLWEVLSNQWMDELPTERILYDFSAPNQAILGNLSGWTTQAFAFSGTETICGQECRVFTVGSGYFSFGQLVESVGLVSANMGDLITQRDPLAGESAERLYGLSHVVDSDGNIIYRGPNYLEFASDITGDGKVDIADVNEVINVMLGKSLTPSPSPGGEGSPADVTGDGQVDIADVNAIINVMLGKR